MSKPPELTLYAYDTRPDIKILKQILEDKELNMTNIEHRLMAIALKYQAMTTAPTTIKKKNDDTYAVVQRAKHTMDARIHNP